MLCTRLHSGPRFSPSINWTKPGTHPHLDAASAPYHLHQSPSQSIGSMTSISYLPQLHSLQQYQACLRSPLQKGERRRENEHHRAHISPYNHRVHISPYLHGAHISPYHHRGHIPLYHHQAHISLYHHRVHTPPYHQSRTPPSLVQSHSTKPTIIPLHTASPNAASTVPQSRPTTVLMKTTRKPLTISESQLWHRHVAHINPTALRSLIDGYTKDDSMCTAYIQAKHKQRIINVKTKRTTKPIELVHSDVCGLFSTPTSAGHHYCILFIDDYTCYTSVSVLPDKKSKTCTWAYQSFQARVDSMGYKVKRFWCYNCRGEYNNKTFRQVFAACGTT